VPLDFAATLAAATAQASSTAFPWLSAAILFPIAAALCIPFVPDKGDGKQVRWFALGVALTKAFVADSAYTHLVFGNFTPDSLLLFDTLDRGPGGYSYYYFDSISVENKTPTGITEVNAPLQITESPNPFTDRCQITIKGAPTSELALLLLDGTGRLVQRIDHLTTGEVTLERHGLPPGGYLYLLRSNEGTLYRGRLLIE